MAVIELYRLEGVGSLEGSYRAWENEMTIRPDFEFNQERGFGYTNLDGFRVYPDYGNNDWKRFPTEKDVMEYLLKEIGKIIAHYQRQEHLDEIAAKRDEKSRSEE